MQSTLPTMYVRFSILAYVHMFCNFISTTGSAILCFHSKIILVPCKDCVSFYPSLITCNQIGLNSA